MVSLGISAKEDNSYIKGEILVQLTKGTNIASFLESFSGQNLRVERKISKYLNAYQFSFSEEVCSTTEMVDLVWKDERVLISQVNHKIEPRQTFPDDFVRWPHHNTNGFDADVDAPEAWDYSTGGSTALGDPVVIAMIDGGFLNASSDMNYWLNTNEIPENGIDDDANGYIDDYYGWNAVDDNHQIPDANGHGESVGGMIGDIGNNGTGNAGLMWDVEIMRVEVFGGANGGGSDEASTIIALDYVINERTIYETTNGADGAFVVATNNSYGGAGDNSTAPLWCAMYDELGALGIISAGATANADVDIDVVGDLPTACPSPYLITVTATSNMDEKHGSGYGLTTIDVGSPSDGSTSMATPNVTGLVGLLHTAACIEFATEFKNDPAATGLLIVDYILNGVEQIPALDGITTTGGRINAFNSVALMLGEQCGFTFPPVVNFTADLNEICPGESISFLDESSLNPSSWLWNFPGGTPSSSTDQNPVVSYPTAGNYLVSLEATNADGSTLSSIVDYISVIDLDGVSIPYEQDFELANDWEVGNPGDDVTMWQLKPDDACFGQVIAVDNFNVNNNGTSDVLSLTFDLANFSNASLGFDVSYAQYDDTYSDVLEIEVSGCGILPTNVFTKGGSDLATAPDETEEFIPLDCTEWRRETVDLSVYDGQEITIRFTNVSGWGNWMYLDNIDVSGTVNTINHSLNVKMRLEGASDGLGGMTVDPSFNNLIPLDQPYNTAPWNYSGTEQLTAVGADMIDWVLVELRDQTDPSLIVAQQAAILNEDGFVMNTDGSPGITWNNINPLLSYTMAIRHRNHLDIMSNALVSISTISIIDLTDPAEVFDQSVVLANLADGYAMRAGDFTGDGRILTSDFNYYYSESSSINQYKNSDCNLNGVCTVSDFNLYQSNLGIISSSPLLY